MWEKLTNAEEPWRARLAVGARDISQVLSRLRRIAVIGIKPEDVGGAAYYVPAYMQAAGLEIVPVPVYYPAITDILGVSVHRTLATITPRADTILLFRRSEHVAQHIDEILAAKPDVVWMQLGIRNDAMAEQLAAAGITVVQDRCLKTELQQRGR